MNPGAVRVGRSSQAILWSWATLAILCLTPFVRAQDANLCDMPGEAPDLVVGDIRGVTRFGTSNGITAFGFGTDACNLGTCWLTWTGASNQHPVISQNIFRLKDGRFEQVGQSWLKHGFGADHAATCSPNCVVPPDYTHLGVNCSDLYDSAENGWQTDMGPKYQVNAYSGNFPFPAANMNQAGNAIYKRLQVHNQDLDPLLNPGAQYFAEIHYVSAEDADAGNGYNNASYRSLAVNGANGFYGFTLTGATIRGEPALNAWRSIDPNVQITPVNVPGDGRVFIAVKATVLGDGFWRYEYAVHNLNESQGVKSFTVPIPSGATVRNIGFHDVDYHSGETQEGVDWSVSTTSTAVTWSASSLPPSGSTPNYLNWGTLYNFRFEADAGPGRHDVTLGLPASGGGVNGMAPMGSSGLPDAGVAADDTGDPVPKAGEVIETLLTPDLCNGDGICAGAESCAGCAADCTHGSECCGNGTCGPGESNRNCHRDCSTVLGSTLTPSRCDSDGICGPGESCSSCPSDCAPQAGRCCGNGTCEPGETDSNCFADCGIASPTETRCGDGVDDDRDGRTDCLDPDCCTDPVCDAFDLDGDTRAAVCDCNDADGRSWETPGEALNLVVANSPPGFVYWSSPIDQGGSRPEYDALRSSNPSDFVTDTVCLPSPDPTWLTASDTELPAPGAVFYYLARARNGCPSGQGTLGAGSNGVPRTGRTCP